MVISTGKTDLEATKWHVKYDAMYVIKGEVRATLKESEGRGRVTSLIEMMMGTQEREERAYGDRGVLVKKRILAFLMCDSPKYRGAQNFLQKIWFKIRGKTLQNGFLEIFGSVNWLQHVLLGLE